MTKELQSTKESLSQRRTARKSLILGSIIATLIAISPYIFYSYESVPSTPTWDTFFGTLESKDYQDMNAAAWIVMMKFVPLFLILIWFFTCRHWWYHALLVPIAMFSFQLVAAINDESQYMDEFHLIYMIPMMAIIIPLIYLTRAKLFNKINQNKSLQELEDELTMRPKNVLDRFKDYF